MRLLHFFKNHKKKVNGGLPPLLYDEVEHCIQELIRVGYFQYAKESDRALLVAAVKTALFNGVLSTVWDEQRPYRAKCHRIFELDDEKLFRRDGFRYYLAQFNFLFERIGLGFVITDYLEHLDKHNKLQLHSITINHKPYTIFNDFINAGCREAACRFAEILNDQLTIQGKQERVYLCKAGSEGELIVLTDQQFAVLDRLLTIPADRPLKPDDWCRIMQVEKIVL